MKRLIGIKIAMATVSIITFSVLIALAEDEKRAGLIQSHPDAYQGFTLLSPLGTTYTFLIDMKGRIVKQWDGEYDGQSAYLLESGHLLRSGPTRPENAIFDAGGAGGSIQEFSWEGEIIWDFKYSSDTFLTHHDIEKLPNGNMLMIAYELKTEAEAIATGRNPETVGKAGLWTDYIIEVKPTGKTTGEIVWEWHLWNHLIQDFDPDKANYGIVADHPELISINPDDWIEEIPPADFEKLKALGYLGGSSHKEQEDANKDENKKEPNPDWNHSNAIDYHPRLDQIVLSVVGFNEIWIIDHSTTTEQSAGHSGGRSGRGGDLLYRWGNPSAYHAGSKADKTLFAQHDIHWISPGLKGADNLLVFNNGRDRPDGKYSSVDEIVPPVDEQGHYVLQKGKAFGPAKPVWSYTAPNKENFFSGHISGAQRLSNCNTLICSGASGTIFEVNAEGKVVWKYINPIRGRERAKRNPENSLFRAFRYRSDYSGLAGRELTPGNTLEEFLAAKQATNWPQWRGPHGNGVGEAFDLPSTWSPNESIFWNIELPSWSGSSPIVWGDRVFVISPSKQEEIIEAVSGPGGAEILLFCISRKDGSVLWQYELDTGNEFRRKHNSTSPSPVTDGNHVWATTGNGVVVSLDMDGNEIWKIDLQKKYGKFGMGFGYASSPLLHEGKLIYQALHGHRTVIPSYIVAIDASTGKELWRHNRYTDAQNESNDAYTTPALLTYKGEDQIVILGADYITGHDLETGKELWRSGGLNPKKASNYRIVPSPVIVDGMIYAPTRKTPLLALRADGTGDITNSHLVWKWEHGGAPDVPTPVCDGKYFYMADDQGQVTCLDAKTGTVVWGPEDIGIGRVTASPVLADGKLYIVSESAETAVVQAGPEYKLMAINKLDGGFTLSTPAVGGNQLFIRTAKYLYCISKQM